MVGTSDLVNIVVIGYFITKFVTFAYERWLERGLPAPIAPVPGAAAAVPAAPQEDVAEGGGGDTLDSRLAAVILLIILAIAAAYLLHAPSVADRSGPPLGTWFTAALAASRGSGVTVRYQYHRFAAGTVPVVECVHHDAAWLLYDAVLPPIPPLSEAAHHDPSLADSEEEERARLLEVREYGARRCVWDASQVMTPEPRVWHPLPNRSLASRSEATTALSTVIIPAAPAPAARVLVRRNGERYLRATSAITGAPVLVLEAALVEAARTWYTALQERAARARVQLEEQQCLCLAHFGVLPGARGETAPLYMRFVGGVWEVLWDVRVRGDAAAQRVTGQFEVGELLDFPYHVVARLALGNVTHYASTFLNYVPLGQLVDTAGGDVYVDAVEPNWLAAATAAGGDSESPLAAVLDVHDAFGKLRRERAVSLFEGGCFAHCESVEAAALMV